MSTARRLLGVKAPLNDCVLVVGDEFLETQGLLIQIEDMGLRVCAAAASLEEAYELASLHRPALVVIDLPLAADPRQREAARRLQTEVGSRLMFIIDRSDAEGALLLQEAVRAGTLPKPFTGMQLQRAVKTMLQE